MKIMKYSKNPILPLPEIAYKFFGAETEEDQSKYFNFIPEVDIAEDDNIYQLHVTIPGMKKEDFKIELNNNLLSIGGERKFVNESNTKFYKSIESNYGHFSRSFNLPDKADTAKIEAEYNDGILKINIPKNESQNNLSTILVK